MAWTSMRQPSLPAMVATITRERYADVALAVGPGYDLHASHVCQVALRDRLNDRLGLLPGIAQWLSQAWALQLRLAVARSRRRGQ